MCEYNRNKHRLNREETTNLVRSDLRISRTDSSNEKNIEGKQKERPKNHRTGSLGVL